MRSRQRALAQRGVVAEHADLAGVRAAVALEDLEQGGLAGAVGAEQGEQLAAADVEVDAVERQDGAVGLAHARRADRRRRGGRPRARSGGGFEGVREHADRIGRGEPRVIGARAEPASPPAGGRRIHPRGDDAARAAAYRVRRVTPAEPHLRRCASFGVAAIVAVLVVGRLQRAAAGAHGRGLLVILVALLAFAGGLWASRPWGRPADRTRLAALAVVGAASVALTAAAARRGGLRRRRTSSWSSRPRASRGDQALAVAAATVAGEVVALAAARDAPPPTSAACCSPSCRGSS